MKWWSLKSPTIKPHHVPEMKSDVTEKTVADKQGIEEEKQNGGMCGTWSGLRSSTFRRIFSDNFRQLRFKAPYMIYFTSE